MQLIIKASVGYLGHNRPFEVMTVKAALNVHFRSVQRSALEICAGCDKELIDAIEYVQKHVLKLSLVDGLIRPNDKVAKWLNTCWRNSFKAQALSKPKSGLFTWETEGFEGGSLHSRKLHVPTEKSGLTIGRGYDCLKRNSTEITKDLMAAGVSGDVANLLSRAAKLQGENVRRFIIKNDMLDWQISVEAQLKLFELILPEYEKIARDAYNRAAKKENKPYTLWLDLKQKLRDILIDLAYRGDYTKERAGPVFDAVRENNLETAHAFFSNRSQWSRVPADRFTRRMNYLKQA